MGIGSGCSSLTTSVVALLVCIATAALRLGRFDGAMERSHPWGERHHAFRKDMIEVANVTIAALGAEGIVAS
jgi:hypothetical protein